MSAVLGDVILGDWILGDDSGGGAAPQTATLNSADASYAAWPIVAGVVQVATLNAPAASYSAWPVTATLSGPIPNAPACWDQITDRLLNYLAEPFTRDRRSLLGYVMGAIARELSNCTETVSLTNATDVRGDGTFVLTTRFEPITAVYSVQRVNDAGTVLQTYSVLSFDGRKIVLAPGLKYGSCKYGAARYGGTPPKRGDRLQVTYSYLHGGLEYRIRQALDELNILTATGDFLDNWGRLFGVPRLTTGKYGSVKYGAIKYGASGRESDTQYARRIIDSIIQVRNTKPSILAVVNRVVGGGAYMVEWEEAGANRGWVFRPAGLAPWTGDNTEDATRYHLIWGQTARFINSAVAGGGGCVAELYVPPSSGSSSFSDLQILQVANSKKAAGIRLFIRRLLPKRKLAVDDSGVGTDAVSLVTSPVSVADTTPLSLYRFDPGAGLLADEGTKLTDLTRSDICEA